MGINVLNVLEMIQLSNVPVTKQVRQQKMTRPTEGLESNKQKSENLKFTCIIVVIQNGFLLESLQLQHHGLNLRGRQTTEEII